VKAEKWVVQVTQVVSIRVGKRAHKASETETNESAAAGGSSPAALSFVGL